MKFLVMAVILFIIVPAAVADISSTDPGPAGTSVFSPGDGIQAAGGPGPDVLHPPSPGTGWKFRSDLHNTGVYDDGGKRPDGTLRWNSTTGGKVESSPAIVDGIVYVGSNDRRVYALDAGTGDRIWTFTTDGEVRSSPAVSGGIVYIGSEYGNVLEKNTRGDLYALDAFTGAKIWNITFDAAVRSSPAVSDGVVYVGCYDDTFSAFNATTGALVWRNEAEYAKSSPAVSGDTVYVGSGDVSVYALDAADGSLRWSFITGGWVDSSPAVADGTVYIGSWDRNVYAINATSGELVWKRATGSLVTSSPAVADGVVYAGSQDGKVYAFDAADGSVLWSKPAGGYLLSSPAVANGVVYIGGFDRNLYALDAQTGDTEWTYLTGGSVTSSPAVADGTVYVGSDDGRVYAIGTPPDRANLMLGNLGPAFYLNASVMNYTLSYRNQGEAEAESVILVDTLPPSVEFVSGTGSPVYDSTARTVTWTLGSLSPHEAGTQVLAVRIPASVPSATVINNTAHITTTTPESRYDDNTANASTTVKMFWLPDFISVTPSVPGPLGDYTVSWRDNVTFSYNQSTCPPETPVNIRIHLYDGGPDIAAPMTGGPRFWYYNTAFYPRYGPAYVTYETPGCVLSGVSFGINIEATGYVYDAENWSRIAGAQVWLQWPDDDGNWVDVPVGLPNPPMQPDQNPIVTFYGGSMFDIGGQYQWDVVEGSWRVYVEAPGYYPAASTMVNTPPQLSGLNIGLTPLPRPPEIFYLSPASTQAGSPAFNLTVNGYNYNAGSTVRWNGADRPTTFISRYKLVASIGADDIATPGNATITVYNPDTGFVSEDRIFTIAGGPLPPASVTNLTNTTYDQNQITWTWTDPQSAGFNHVMIYLDGAIKENVTGGVQTWTATNLSPGTWYTIGTRTAGTDGLVNQTWVNHTARTAPPAGPGILWVASYPRDATIYIDGIVRGRTNQFVYNVPAGARNLTLMKGGYRTVTTTVNVPPGLTVLPPVTLQPDGGPQGTGSLYVASYPSGATITIDGTVYGRTDQVVYNVPAGNRNLTLSKAGYRPRTLFVDVPAGDLRVLPPVALEPV